MSIASTHTGTCQACGRRQAVHINTGLIAKHGDKQTVDVGNKEGETLKVEGKPIDPLVVSALTEALLTQKTDK